LCSTGTASQVGGTGPWTWTCAGSNGGSPASCSDLLEVNGSCGPANGADASSAPTTGLCSVGAPSQVGGIGPWNWTCAGSNGGSPASCSDLLTVDGSCGSANNADASSAPTTGLCSAGAPSQVAGSGPWNWTCAGSNGGSPAYCSDLLTLNGFCGPANGADALSAPTTNLCSVGIASQVVGTGPWSWTCIGSNGGLPASCSDILEVNGACGPANGTVEIEPTTGFCSAGTASQVTGSGPWSWTCTGNNGGSTASCSASLIPFNVLTTTWNSFTPGSLSDYPTVASVNGLEPSVGFQDGVFVNEKAIYFPWLVSNGGDNWIEHIQDGILNSVIISYNGASGVAGFNNPNNWSWFDLTMLSWQGKGTLPNTPAVYIGGAVAGNMVYPAPSGHNLNPIFIAYDASQPLNSSTAYQTFVPPPTTTPKGSTPAPGTGALGPLYGWCEAVYDGSRYVYYVPGDGNGNIVRYDTTQPFGNLRSWSSFDMKAKVNTGAQGFQSVAYDGNRFIYFIPFHDSENLIVRYDTWGGGSAPNPAAFTNPASYTTFNPLMLGSSGYPTITGQGNPANLSGFTGAAIAWDSAHENEYLYFVPWAVYLDGAQTPTGQSTTARVRIGTQNGSTWNYVDITSTNAPAASSPNWEIYDLSQLTINPAWPTTWPTVYPNSAGSANVGQSEIAGWQLAFVSPTPPTKVGFVPDKSQYLVEHNVDHDLFDPSGWYVAPLASGYPAGTMGGAYDSVNQILYPSSPGENPLFSVHF
jgi:hypothetical protein